MEVLLRKYLFVLDLVVVALAALFLARATSSSIASAFLLQPPLVELGPAPRPRPPRSQYRKDTLPILERNIFCSDCPSLTAQPEVEGETEPVATGPVKTSLPLQLMAVMVAPPPYDERWSMAVLKDTERGILGPFGTGEVVRSGTVVASIEPTRIYLDRDGRSEYLDLLDESTAPPAVSRPRPRPGARPEPEKKEEKPDETIDNRSELSAALDEGVKKTGEHTYEVKRGTVDAVLGNMSVLSRSARIVPEVRDGKPAGFRLYSIRPNSPFAKIGLQNGDVISSINGLGLTSPDKALEAYTKLRSANHLSVGVERRGQKVNKEYSIR